MSPLFWIALIIIAIAGIALARKAMLPHTYDGLVVALCVAMTTNAVYNSEYPLVAVYAALGSVIGILGWKDRARYYTTLQSNILTHLAKHPGSDLHEMAHTLKARHHTCRYTVHLLQDEGFITGEWVEDPRPRYIYRTLSQGKDTR